MARRKKGNEILLIGPTGIATGISTGTATNRIIIGYPASPGQIGRMEIRGHTVGTGTALITMSTEKLAGGSSIAVSSSVTFDLDAAANTQNLGADGNGTTFDGNDALDLFLSFDAGTATAAATFSYGIWIQI